MDPMTIEGSFSRFNRLRRRYLQLLLSSSPVSRGQPAVLAALSESPGLSQTSLARAINVRPPTATALVQRLVESGMVVRKPDRNDRRMTRLFLTNQGFAEAQQLQSVRHEEELLVRTVLSPQETDQLVRLLNRVSDQYVSAVDVPPRLTGVSDTVPLPGEPPSAV